MQNTSTEVQQILWLWMFQEQILRRRDQGKCLSSSAKVGISSRASSYYRDQICLSNYYVQILRNESAYHPRKSNQSLVIPVLSFVGTEYP